MSIINKGVFDAGKMFILQTGNDWPTSQTTTADVAEVSSNLYFTNTRVLSALVGANVLVNNLVVSGDFEVQGNVVQINASVLNIEDINIVLANGAVTSAAVDGAGIAIHGSQANITYRNTGDKFVINKNTDFTGNVTANAFVSNGDITATSNIIARDVRSTGNVTANAIISNGDITTTSNIIARDVRASGNLIANGLIIRNISVSDSVLTGNLIVTTISNASSITANTITSQVWNGLYTANVIESPTNLYYTNARVITAVTPTQTTANVIETNTNLYYTNSRVRSAFTAGRGIIITDDGTVKSTIGSELFNPSINYAKDYNVTATMSTALTIPSTPVNDRYVLRSMHITNISDSVAFVSSNVLYAGGNTAYLGSLIPVPVGSIVEFMDRAQLMHPGDKINLQGFNASQVATSGLLSSYFTYESISSDVTYVGTGSTLAASNTNIQIIDADQSDTVIESLKVVNLKTYSVPVKVFFAYANATPKAYMAFNMQVPPNTSVELLQAPKLIYFTDKVFASYANASDGDAISIFPSYRRNAVTNQGNISTTATIPGGNIDISYYTTLVDGTTLYYTLE